MDGSRGSTRSLHVTEFAASVLVFYRMQMKKLLLYYVNHYSVLQLLHTSILHVDGIGAVGATKFSVQDLSVRRYLVPTTNDIISLIHCTNYVF